VVVSPDAGFVAKARKFAKRLHAPMAMADKERTDHSEQVQILSVMGDVRDRTALLVDDFIISGGTLVQATTALKDLGASRASRPSRTGCSRRKAWGLWTTARSSSFS
jgi:ribose-phosphate pyrophosphokinase